MWFRNKSAFPLLPVSPVDFDLLGFRFQGSYYFDKMLPFVSKKCALFDKFASFLHWLTQKYMYSQNNSLKSICSDIGVHISYVLNLT